MCYRTPNSIISLNRFVTLRRLAAGRHEKYSSSCLRYFISPMFKIVLSLTFIILLLVPSILYAQYFGRNRVQYETFDFQVLHSDHFDIYHYPETGKAIKNVARLSERWYERYTGMLNHTFQTQNPVIFYANQADFQQTDILARVGVGTGGVTEGLRNRVIMPFAETNTGTNHVLGHELVHAFQYDIAQSEDVGGIATMSQLPLWFIEGMAEYLSVGPQNTQTAMWLRDAVLYDDLPSLDDLSNSQEYFPYRYGHAVWSFIGGTWGDEVVPELYKTAAANGLDVAFGKVLGTTIDSVSTMWQSAVSEQYGPELDEKTKPEETGKLILGEEQGTGTMNVSPSVSPDGNRVVFISEKEIFSLELFLANAETGDVIRRLTTTFTDPHLSALQFIESSGSWSPDGQRFAAVVFQKGDTQIIIIDTNNGKTVRTLAFDSIGAVTNPAWAPDGNRIVFSGLQGGHTDLYLYNMETDSLSKLMDDAYSDIHPEWSPDGSKIAFATDRGAGTNLDMLNFSELAIAVMDVNTGKIEMLPKFYDSKHINPQYSPDGGSLYFVSDYRGYNDIYRYEFQTGRRYKITNIATGISGISEHSPAVSVADSSGDLLATVFHETNYSVFQIPEEELQGREIINFSRVLSTKMLPGTSEGSNVLVSNYLQNYQSGLPADTAFTLTDYVPDVSLEYVTGGGGVGYGSQYGVGAGGGVNLYFSDMLRQHQVFTTLQLQGQLRDIGADVTYLNTKRRFTWGIGMSHFSFLSRATGTAVDTIQIDEGTAAEVLRVDQVNRRLFVNRVSAIGMYPISQINRVELNANFQRFSYDYELIQAYLSPGGGFVFDETRQDLEAPSALELVSGSVAYVEDNSISAFTGPIRGRRARFEVQTTTGSLQYLTALADMRRYFYVQPFTLAFRGLHYGRYLRDSESDRLNPNFVGYESMVRGYNIASFDPQECSGTSGGECPELERLFGSRMAVGNVELRVPILGIEDIALFRTRILPVTFTAFFDGGVAWSDEELPIIEWERESTERIPVFSSGVSLRFNVLGYLIAELYYAYPYQRPEKGGYIGFHIAPGW